MKLTKEQIELMKSNLDEMEESDEQFIFMIYRKPNGDDNITEFSHNIPTAKLNYYLQKALKRGEIRKG